MNRRAPTAGSRFLAGIALGATTLAATLASADPSEVPRLPHDAPVASTADPAPPRDVAPALSSELRRPSTSLNIDLKIDAKGFRVGGRLSGSKGVSSASLGALVRDDGVTLDGRIEGHDGPSRDFTLNLDLMPGWARTAARLWLLLP
jgi:hypothetical protein